MARDNMEVQNRIFERLELLLEIKGAHQELSAMLTEVSQFKRSLIPFRSIFIRFCIYETYVFYVHVHYVIAKLTCHTKYIFCRKTGHITALWGNLG